MEDENEKTWEVPLPLQELSTKVGLRRLEVNLEERFGLRGRNWGTYWIGFTDGSLFGASIVLILSSLFRFMRKKERGESS